MLYSDQPIVVLLVHKALQGRETTVHYQLQIAELALVEDDGRELLCLSSELGTLRSIAGDQVLEDTT